MKKLTVLTAMLATIGLSTAVYAQGNAPANQNNSPQSSTNAMPKGKKHSAGTVGAMQNAGGSSFTADKNAQKKVHLNSNGQ